MNKIPTAMNERPQKMRENETEFKEFLYPLVQSCDEFTKLAQRAVDEMKAMTKSQLSDMKIVSHEYLAVSRLLSSVNGVLSHILDGD